MYMNAITHKIRLVGPTQTSNNRINNYFNVPIKIKPGAKIGIKTAVFDLLEDINDETYTLTSTADRTLELGDPTNNLSTTIAAITDVDITALRDAITTAANYALGEQTFPFTNSNYKRYADYNLDANNARFELAFSSYPRQGINWGSEWKVELGAGNLTTFTDTILAKGAGELLVDSPYIPRASSQFTFTVQTPGEFTLAYGSNGNPNRFDVGIDLAVSTYQVDGNPVGGGYGPTAGDRVSIAVAGQQVLIQVRDAAGIIQVNESLTLGDRDIEQQFYTLACDAASGALDLRDLAASDGLTYIDRQSLTSERYDFNVSSKLAKYLGIGTSNRFTDTLIGKQPINGDDTFTGLLLIADEVKVNGLDGANGRQDNVVAIIDKDSLEGRNVKYKPNEIDIISLNMQRETVLNQFTMRLRALIGGDPLPFGPEAYVELNLYE